MKLFRQTTQIHKFTDASAFAEAFHITAQDFILASRSTFLKYFAPLDLKAQIAFKSDYGNGEPTIQMYEQLLSDFRKTDCQRIIAIGGGAVIDMAKLLTLAGDAPAEDYFKHRIQPVRVRELIAIPTTCGAGSEVTNIAIAEFPDMQTKLGLAVDALYPDHAVLIPELLTDLPYKFFAASAIDALIHAIESYLSPKANAYTKTFSIQASSLILRGFRQIAAHGQEHRLTLLEDFLIASDMAGIAFGNAGTATVHAMSYPLSGVYHVTHGEANYQFFLEVLRAYERLQPDGQIEQLCDFLAAELDCRPADALNRLSALLDQILTRQPLHLYGMKEEEIDGFTDSILKSQQRLLQNSYVPMTREELRKIYAALY